jgi:hypothetical protein
MFNVEFEVARDLFYMLISISSKAIESKNARYMLAHSDRRSLLLMQELMESNLIPNVESFKNDNEAYITFKGVASVLESTNLGVHVSFSRSNSRINFVRSSLCQKMSNFQTSFATSVFIASVIGSKGKVPEGYKEIKLSVNDEKNYLEHYMADFEIIGIQKVRAVIALSLLTV